MPRSCLVLRVFTRGPQGGNHLGVVTDLDGLETTDMQRIATDLGFSETIFVDTSDAVPIIRIFTPGMELLFAGHPLVGAASVMLDQSGGAVDRLRCGIGDVAIRRDGNVIWVDVPMVVANAHPDSAEFAHRVGLTSLISTWRVSMPLDYRMVEVGSARDVAAARPNTGAFEREHGLTLFARDAADVRMRFFAPVAGVDEDPATGSAAVALATMYAARGEAEGRLVIDQGEEIGHPSRINLRWAGTTASIGGTVVADEMRELAI